MAKTPIFILFLLLLLSASSQAKLLRPTRRHLSSIGRLTTFVTELIHPRITKTYHALQAWKTHIHSDPTNFTDNWVGHDVCSYNGVFCAPALDDPTLHVVAGIDLNHADIAGQLPPEIGDLTDLSLLHLNTNRFCGIVPESLARMSLLHELDLSNNQFMGSFPVAVLALPRLKYLDLRFNDFEGELPSQLFDKPLDAIFMNGNRFHSSIPASFGNSPASVIVLSDNMLTGCIPTSVSNMAGKLDELLLSGNDLCGCLPEEITLLNSTTVLDVNSNDLIGNLPMKMNNLRSLEVIDLGRNNFRSKMPDSVCNLPRLKNITISYNYFEGRGRACSSVVRPGLCVDDKMNCFSKEKNQRPENECRSFLSQEADCHTAGCRSGASMLKQPSHSPNISPVQSPMAMSPIFYP